MQIYAIETFVLFSIESCWWFQYDSVGLMRTQRHLQHYCWNNRISSIFTFRLTVHRLWERMLRLVFVHTRPWSSTHSPEISPQTSASLQWNNVIPIDTLGNRKLTCACTTRWFDMRVSVYVWFCHPTHLPFN